MEATSVVINVDTDTLKRRRIRRKETQHVHTVVDDNAFANQLLHEQHSVLAAQTSDPIEVLSDNEEMWQEFWASEISEATGVEHDKGLSSDEDAFGHGGGITDDS